MRRSHRAVAAFLALSLLTASCADELPSTSTTTTGSASAPATTTSLPPRPFTISVAAADPCQWLKPEEHADFKIENPARPHKDESVLKSTECVWSANGADYRLGYSTVKGVEYWLAPGARVETTIGSVAGFPAVQIRHTVLKGCDVAVDVGPQQQVFAAVMISPSFEGKFPPRCESAEKMAESAMRALGAK